MKIASSIAAPAPVSNRRRDMPKQIRALVVAGLLCLASILAFCQDNPPRTAHRRAETVQGNSFAHYRLGETYLSQNNLQSAANEFREAQQTGDNTHSAPSKR